VVGVPFFVISVEVLDKETEVFLVKESHIAYTANPVIDDIVEEFARMLEPQYNIDVGRENGAGIIRVLGECTFAKIEIYRLQKPSYYENRCRDCYPSKAFEHIRHNVSVDEIIKDVIDEIDRYMVPD
jgi:hypothetical protein